MNTLPVAQFCSHILVCVAHPYEQTAMCSPMFTLPHLCNPPSEQTTMCSPLLTLSHLSCVFRSSIPRWLPVYLCLQLNRDVLMLPFLCVYKYTSYLVGWEWAFQFYSYPKRIAAVHTAIVFDKVCHRLCTDWYITD